MVQAAAKKDADVATFSKDQPCTKIEIWNCFRARTGFRVVPVVEARRMMGRSVPNHLVREGKAEHVTNRRGECLKLTPDGEQWLTEGTERYVRNKLKHEPSIVRRLQNPLRRWKFD